MQCTLLERRIHLLSAYTLLESVTKGALELRFMAFRTYFNSSMIFSYIKFWLVQNVKYATPSTARQLSKLHIVFNLRFEGSCFSSNIRPLARLSMVPFIRRELQKQAGLVPRIVEVPVLIRHRNWLEDNDFPSDGLQNMGGNGVVDIASTLRTADTKLQIPPLHSLRCQTKLHCHRSVPQITSNIFKIH